MGGAACFSCMGLGSWTYFPDSRTVHGGMLIGRRGWFLRKSLGGWGRALAIALVCYFPIYGLNNMVGNYIENTNVLTPLSIILSSLANLCFMAILVSGLLYAYYCTGCLSRVLSRLIPYGRMSMTNYVTQGMIGSALYYHWGLYLRVGITGSVLIGIAIFAVQYMACRIWVNHHSHSCWSGSGKGHMARPAPFLRR